MSVYSSVTLPYRKDIRENKNVFYNFKFWRF